MNSDSDKGEYMEWKFKKLAKDDKNRDPMQAAYFTIENINDHAQALVRESIQNALDEKVEGREKIFVRFFFSTEANHINPEKSVRYFGGAFQNFRSPESGLHDVPEENEVCRYLVYEDFNTHGLTGDPLEYYDQKDKNNRFYYYFRAEGRSGKGEADRGRWGIGKYVFPGSSRINSFMALTVRHDDQRELLAGQAVLKSHRVDGIYYTPDGWFGDHLDRENPNRPVENAEYISEFKKTFNLRRKNGESGLSIVVPYVKQEINAKMLIKYVLLEYYYPIHFGNLEVEIEDGSDSVKLTSDNLQEVIRLYLEAGKEKEKILQILNICQAGYENIENGHFIGISKPKISASKIQITRDLFTENDLTKLRAAFLNEEICSVRIPIDIFFKLGNAAESCFDIHFQKNPSLSDGIPVFIREGILIPDQIRGVNRARDILTVVNIEDKVIARFLGDSENPAHTEWQHQADRLYKYNYARSYIIFVKRCIYDLSLLLSDDGEKDFSTLKDLFPVPVKTPEGMKTPETASKKQKPKTSPKETPPETSGTSKKKPIYYVEQFENGIVIQSTGEQVDGEYRFTAKFAYAVPDGNPFKKWSPFDFSLNDDVQIDFSGSGIKQIKVLKDRENTVSFNVTNEDFKISFSGFDINRDLAFDVSKKEVSDENI